MDFGGSFRNDSALAILIGQLIVGCLQICREGSLPDLNSLFIKD